MQASIALIALLGRILLGGYFLYAGVNNARNFSKLIGVVEKKGVPLPGITLAVAVCIQLIGSLLVIFNFYAWLGALGLIGFTAVTLYYFCDFWNKEGWERQLVTFLFSANLSVVGGLLYLLAMSMLSI